MTSHHTLVALVAEDLLGSGGTLPPIGTSCPAHGPSKQAATEVDADDGLRKREVCVGVGMGAEVEEALVERTTGDAGHRLSAGGEPVVAGIGLGTGMGAGGGGGGGGGGRCCYRYRRALLSCMAQREFGQMRLGAIAAVRCLVRNPVLRSESVAASAVGTADDGAEVPGPEAVAVSFAHQASRAALSGGVTDAMAVVAPFPAVVAAAEGILVEGGADVGGGRSSEGLPPRGEAVVAVGVCAGGYGNSVSGVEDGRGTNVDLEGWTELSTAAAAERPRAVEAPRGGGAERWVRDGGFEEVWRATQSSV